MKISRSVLLLIIVTLPILTIAQDTYLPEGAKEYQFIDRMEIKAGNNTNLNFSTIKPYNRRYVVQEATYLDSLLKESKITFSKSDVYNLQSLKNNNEEWYHNGINDVALTTYNTLYKNKQHLVSINSKGFFLVADPLIQLQEGIESFNRNHISLSTFGLTTRGIIAKSLGFSFSISDNFEKGPQYFTDRVLQYNAVPGEGNFATKSNGVFNYADVRGYLTLNASKYIDIQVGYDKNFIGNGYRSMFLSDFASSYPFIKINTRIWKLNYENIFAQLEPLNFGGIIKTSQRKYMAMHHLSINFGKKVNVGIFESIISARSNHFDFAYLNPIIFLRQVEGNVGSPDKAHVGIDLKVNAAKKYQFYGQFMLDEFLFHQFIKHTGFYANKWAFQGGVKYIDALNIKNLDLQLEANIVRPFTYSHYDPVTNYSTFNQPLADPLGANFHELIAIAKYQPAPRWRLNGRIIYYDQGLDSAGQNMGSNIFIDYRIRTRDYGYKIAGGNKAKCLNANLDVSYELYDNLFLEGSALVRNYTVANGVGNNKTAYFTLGVRWNIAKRAYDY